MKRVACIASLLGLALAAVPGVASAGGHLGTVIVSHGNGHYDYRHGGYDRRHRFDRWSRYDRWHRYHHPARGYHSYYGYQARPRTFVYFSSPRIYLRHHGYRQGRYCDY